MASSLGTHQEGSVNVELNIVPFIDLMSCLTAFLLVTAVWINLANIQNQPAGRSREAPNDVEQPKLSILLEYDQMIVTQTPTGEIRQMPSGDWDKLTSALHELKSLEPLHVEIAAASSDAHPIAYQTLIAAMDTAVRAGYPDIGVTDPASLSR
ncbi:MAG: Biopolymer transport protein ExbD/TolR [Myxococcales bacterium]|nr:Biopolymer transport protein ExbD/TolR [Myxococcales bacterium]